MIINRNNKYKIDIYGMKHRLTQSTDRKYQRIEEQLKKEHII